MWQKRKRHENYQFFKEKRIRRAVIIVTYYFLFNDGLFLVSGAGSEANVLAFECGGKLGIFDFHQADSVVRHCSRISFVW